ncbi:MAG TPA: hypothetical protein VF531_06125 [Bacillota bacterium]
MNTPGHSDDSISFVMYLEGAFTGDLHPTNQVSEDLLGVVNESWRKIKQTGLKVIFPGHGPSFNIDNSEPPFSSI